MTPVKSHEPPPVRNSVWSSRSLEIHHACSFVEEHERVSHTINSYLASS